MALTLFTVSVSAHFHLPDSTEVVELVARALHDWGVLDAAVTYGDGIISYTAQIEATDAVTASIMGTSPLTAIGASVTKIEVEPCLIPEQSLMAV